MHITSFVKMVIIELEAAVYNQIRENGNMRLAPRSSPDLLQSEAGRGLSPPGASAVAGAFGGDAVLGGGAPALGPQVLVAPGQGGGDAHQGEEDAEQGEDADGPHRISRGG
jgi:hypothetical protein